MNEEQRTAVSIYTTHQQNCPRSWLPCRRCLHNLPVRSATVSSRNKKLISIYSRPTRSPLPEVSSFSSTQHIETCSSFECTLFYDFRNRIRPVAFPPGGGGVFIFMGWLHLRLCQHQSNRLRARSEGMYLLRRVVLHTRKRNGG